MCNIYPQRTTHVDQDRRLTDLIQYALNQNCVLTLRVTNSNLSDEEVVVEFKLPKLWRGDLEWLIECSGEVFNFKDCDDSNEYIQLFAAPNARQIFDYLKGFGCTAHAELTQACVLF